MIARKDFLRRMLGGVLVAVGGFLGTNILRAAPRRKKKDDSTPPPSPTPEPSPSATPLPEDKKETAKLRLWKISDVPDVPVQLRFLPHGKADSAAVSPLEVQTASYQFTNYSEVPAGPQVIEVSAPDRTTVRLPLYLGVGAASTLLIRLKGPTLTAEWIDDTVDPADAGCQFDVYNLLFASNDLQVDLGMLMTVHLGPGRSNARLTGIKRGLYSAITSGVDGAGKSFHWTAEVDLRQSRKVALLIYPDAYGRIRPRTIAV